MKRNQLPKDVIEQWPEILRDIEVTAIPLEYLHSIKISFSNGKIWDIDISKHTKTIDFTQLEKHISELLEKYDESIENIDFRLDIEKVKKDVIKNTKTFLKKTK